MSKKTIKELYKELPGKWKPQSNRIITTSMPIVADRSIEKWVKLTFKNPLFYILNKSFTKKYLKKLTFIDYNTPVVHQNAFMDAFCDINYVYNKYQQTHNRSYNDKIYKYNKYNDKETFSFKRDWVSGFLKIFYFNLFALLEHKDLTQITEINIKKGLSYTIGLFFRINNIQLQTIERIKNETGFYETLTTKYASYINENKLSLSKEDLEKETFIFDYIPEDLIKEKLENTIYENLNIEEYISAQIIDCFDETTQQNNSAYIKDFLVAVVHECELDANVSFDFKIKDKDNSNILNKFIVPHIVDCKENNDYYIQYGLFECFNFVQNHIKKIMATVSIAENKDFDFDLLTVNVENLSLVEEKIKNLETTTGIPNIEDTIADYQPNFISCADWNTDCLESNDIKVLKDFKHSTAINIKEKIKTVSDAIIADTSIKQRLNLNDFNNSNKALKLASSKSLQSTIDCCDTALCKKIVGNNQIKQLKNIKTRMEKNLEENKTVKTNKSIDTLVSNLSEISPRRGGNSTVSDKNFQTFANRDKNIKRFAKNIVSISKEKINKETLFLTACTSVKLWKDCYSLKTLETKTKQFLAKYNLNYAYEDCREILFNYRTIIAGGDIYASNKIKNSVLNLALNEHSIFTFDNAIKYFEFIKDVFNAENFNKYVYEFDKAVYDSLNAVLDIEGANPYGITLCVRALEFGCIKDVLHQHIVLTTNKENSELSKQAIKFKNFNRNYLKNNDNPIVEIGWNSPELENLCANFRKSPIFKQIDENLRQKGFSLVNVRKADDVEPVILYLSSKFTNPVGKCRKSAINILLNETNYAKTTNAKTVSPNLLNSFTLNKNFVELLNKKIADQTIFNFVKFDGNEVSLNDDENTADFVETLTSYLVQDLYVNYVPTNAPMFKFDFVGNDLKLVQKERNKKVKQIKKFLHKNYWNDNLKLSKQQLFDYFKTNVDYINDIEFSFTNNTADEMEKVKKTIKKYLLKQNFNCSFDFVNLWSCGTEDKMVIQSLEVAEFDCSLAQFTLACIYAALYLGHYIEGVS